MKPNCLIIRTAGTNCDRELAYAFEQAGATARIVHLNRLIDRPELLEEARLIGLPGGFSYGDDIAAGRILANRLRHRLLAPIQAAVRRGTPVIGICNGFQVLCKLGLLPHPERPQQTTTLADNTSARFVDRWVRCSVPQSTVCIWTRGLGALELPVAHAEGRFVAQDRDVLEALEEGGQVAIRYAADDNPNGSTADIAGICDPSGLVLGLMPHPERFTDPTHHPSWTRWSAEQLANAPAGLRFFENAVERVASQQASVGG